MNKLKYPILKDKKNINNKEKENIRQMFDNIAPSYDFLNHFFSFGIDHLWRRKLVKILMPSNPNSILDIATGTGDLAISEVKLNPEKIIGIDISEKMIKIGKEKVTARKLNDIISFKQADASEIPFKENSFDAVTVAFVVRNFEYLDKSLSGIFRVLKNNGQIAVLEFSMPDKFPFKQIYLFYLNKIIPFLGKLISKDVSAYSYLSVSIGDFPSGEDFLKHLRKAGFSKTFRRKLTFGVASVYVGKKI